MKATITINMDNAAFEELPSIELARILQKLAEHISGYELVYAPETYTLKDINGNTVGKMQIRRQTK